MGKGTDPPESGQRRRARRALTEADWQRIAAPETQRAINRAIGAFIRRHARQDVNRLHGLALDEVMKAVVDWVDINPAAWPTYVYQRVIWALGQYRRRRWYHYNLLREHYEQVADAPRPDAWELLGGAARLQLQRRAVELLDSLPADHSFVLRKHYLEGVPIKSLAVELGMSATAAGRLHRDALARLKAEMVRRGWV